MAITFNTNLAALGAQRNIGLASTAASSSLSKLSSGSRVPQAKDDAAALAIGSKLKAEVAGLTQASNNAGQAISLLQIADGALATVGDVLQRMKALAVQSSSGQLADADRSLLNQEYTSLRDEIDRVANLTNFNGTTLLNGGETVAATRDAAKNGLASYGIEAVYDTSLTGASDAFRIVYNHTDNTTDGSGGGQTADQTDTGMMTLYNLTTGESVSVDIAQLVRNKTAEAADSTGEGGYTDYTFDTNLSGSDTVDVTFGGMGVTLRLNKDFDVNTDINVNASGEYVTVDSNLSTSVAGTNATVITASNFYTGGTNGLDSGHVFELGTATANGLNDLGAAVWDRNTGVLTLDVAETETGGANNDTLVFSATGLQFSTDGGSTWGANATATSAASGSTTVDVRLTTSTNRLFSFTIDNTTTDALVTASASAKLRVQVGAGLFGAEESTSAAKDFSFKVGTGTSADDDIAFTLSAATVSALSLTGSAIDSADNAETAITAVGAAITTVSSRRADIGAAESRLAFAQNSINISMENTTAAQSSLLDVDVSSEITKFTNQNVLMQAGISLLGQANQQPALLLRLLQ